MTDNTQQAMQIAEQLARGTIALDLLAELSEHVARYDTQKQDADNIFAGKLADARDSLVFKITNSIRRAGDSLESIRQPEDADDYDDD